MSALSSQDHLALVPSTSDSLPLLTRPANVALFLRVLREILRSQYGVVGQNILNSTTTTLINPGPCPHYNDPRLHPITAAPIPNSRKYEQAPPTNAQSADPTFDHNTLPLTEAGENKLNQDIKTWNSNTDRYNRLLDKHRTHDDELLTLLRRHISADALEVIKSSPSYPAFLALPADCISRSDAYIKIVDSKFFHGNSTVSINELTKFLMSSATPQPHSPIDSPSITTAYFLSWTMQQPSLNSNPCSFAWCSSKVLTSLTPLPSVQSRSTYNCTPATLP